MFWSLCLAQHSCLMNVSGRKEGREGEREGGTMDLIFEDLARVRLSDSNTSAAALSPAAA